MLFAAKEMHVATPGTYACVFSILHLLGRWWLLPPPFAEIPGRPQVAERGAQLPQARLPWTLRFPFSSLESKGKFRKAPALFGKN